MMDSHSIQVPDNHVALILPITDDPDDAGGQLMDTGVALHHIVELLDNNQG